MVEYNLAWRIKAHAIIEEVARSNKLVVSDMVIAALEEADMGLNNYSGLGGVFKRAANAGFIAKTDETVAGNRKSHSAKTVWRSLIYKDAVPVSPELDAINAMAVNALEFNAGTIRLASLVYGHFGDLKPHKQKEVVKDFQKMQDQYTARHIEIAETLIKRIAPEGR